MRFELVIILALRGWCEPLGFGFKTLKTLATIATRSNVFCAAPAEASIAAFAVGRSSFVKRFWDLIIH